MGDEYRGTVYPGWWLTPEPTPEPWNFGVLSQGLIIR